MDKGTMGFYPLLMSFIGCSGNSHCFSVEEIQWVPGLESEGERHKEKKPPIKFEKP